MSSSNLVLRTIYIDPDVDNALRTEAFDNRTSKNDLVRKYLRLGMEAAKKAPASLPAVAASVPKIKATVRAANVKTANSTVKPAGAKEVIKRARKKVAEAS